MPTVPNIVCPVCGTENASTRLFCRKCASDLHATVLLPGQTPPPPPTQVPIRPIFIGGGIALVLVVLAVIGIVALNGSPAVLPSPSPEATGLTPPSAGPTLSPSRAPTAVPATRPSAATPTAPPTQGPTQTDGPPIIRFFTGPASVNCSDPAFAGQIHLSWRIGNADGANLSIDGPGVYGTYTGVLNQADVPFACDGQQHTYILVTVGGIDPPAEKDLVIGPAATP